MLDFCLSCYFNLGASALVMPPWCVIIFNGVIFIAKSQFCVASKMLDHFTFLFCSDLREKFTFI